ATAYTFAADPGMPTFSNVLYTSFTVTWADNGNPNTTPYEVSFSTDSTFATGVSTPIALTDNYVSTSTALTGLMPSTTYYVRIRAENNDSAPDITAFSTVGDTETLAAVVPVLSGNALSVSSIHWSWTTIPGATAYRLYNAASTTTLIVQQVGTTFDEPN